jgi:ornithine cyclodeaminase
MRLANGYADGIGGAIATKALAAKNAKKVLIIGSGIQAQFQANCLASLMPEDHLISIFGVEI